MAGIISNVDSDVQKLRKLKNEIENVKKALKGINITVDIDIAKGLQSQLTSLIGQYDTLVDKIAAAEGKIMLSVSRINKATEKIVQAQEKVSKVVSAPTQIGDANTQTNTAETASIQAQAKAYDDLRTEINDILGTRDANVKRLVEEMNAIRLINAEIKKITKSQSESSSLSSTQQRRLEQLNNSLLTHKTALSEVRQTLNNNVKLDNAAATSMNGLSQSLSRMKMTYRELTEEERKSSFGKKLLESINQADTKMKELDATIGNHQRNVGNYGKQWNGLSMSIQQLGRELPSLAYGPKVFFSAISNNLPILADEIRRARTEYELLKKSGQSATPVWKQAVSSLFSWQSALTVGITLLTLYGDKVVDWVTELFKAKEAIKELLSAEQEMALARKKAISDSTKERAELDLLYNKLKGTSLSTKERTAAVNEWMKKYPQHSNIMNGELVSLGKLESAYQSLSKQIIESAKARSYSDRITELESKRFDANFKRLNQKKTLGIAESEYLRTKEIYEKLQKDYDSGKSVGQALSTARVSYMNAKEEYEKQKEIYDNLEKETNDYASKINYIAEQIKVDDLYPQPEEGTHDYWQQQVQIADVALKQIDSKQKALLDNAVKDPKKDLYGLGIDKSIVDSYKQAIKLKTEAEKELKVYDSSSKQENQAEKLRKEQEKYALLQSKQSQDNKRQSKDLEFEATQSRIDAMQQGSERTIAQMKLNHQKEVESLKRNREDYLRKKIEAERSLFEANPSNKGKSFDTSTISLSKDEEDMFKNIIESTISKQGNEISSYYKDLLAKYQSYTEKRLATQKKFQEERDSLVKAGASKETLTEHDYQRDEALESIDNEFAMREDSFKAWADNIADLSLEKLRELLVQAERELERSEFLNPNDPKLAGQRAKVTSLKNTIGEKSEKTSTSPNKRSQKEWQDLYNTLSKVERQFDEIGNTVGGTAGEIISAAGGIATSTLQMIDGIVTLANGSSEAMSGTAQAASASIQAVEKASVILAIIGAALQIATKLASLFGNSSMEYYESLKDELGAINEIYGDIIEKSKEKIVFGGGFAALESYREANDLLERQIENYRKLAEAGGDARKTGSHSYAYRANERLSGRSASGKSGVEAGKGRFEDISEVLGKNITKVQDLYNLTGEELYLVQTKFPEAWSKIPEEITDSLQAIIDCREESEKLRDSLNEAITGVSFDSFYNEFIDMLSDMDMSAEDMAENFGEYLRKSILAAMVAKNFQEDINKLYDKWVAAGEEDSLGGMTITEDEARDIQDGYKKLVDAMVQARDNMSQAFGWDSSATSQDSSSRGFQTMSQDTGEELNGRFTALQVAGEEIKNQNVIQSQSLNLLTAKADAILSINTETRNIADDTRDLIAQSYLELVQISENTGAIVKPIQQMQRDIAEVKKNTAKL